MSGLMERLKRRWKHLWLRPIRVFCFHQVSDMFEPDTMKECDWMSTKSFKRTVSSLKKKYVFISIQEAYHHIANDRWRFHHYAVLTADDGWVSLLNVLPWLSENEIPVTLFLNPSYLSGERCREKETERYLLTPDIDCVSETCLGVSFGMHGWEHIDMSILSEDEFRKNLEQSVQALKGYGVLVPFFAYPWGRHNALNDRILKEFKLVPVLMDGMVNYNDVSQIHRELLTVEPK